MANTSLFRSTPPVMPVAPQPKPKAATTTNLAGGMSYKLGDKLALAMFACTGCLNDTFYATAESQMDKVIEMCKNVPADFIAKVAVYSRKHSFMKDMPALLLAILSGRNSPLLFRQTFCHVIDNGKMLQTFVQIVRSGKVCSKHINGAKRRAINEWFRKASVQQIINGMAGNEMPLSSILKLSHPKPSDSEKEALFGWLLDLKPWTEDGARENVIDGKYISRQYNPELLPAQIKELEAFKRGDSTKVPRVPFLFLAGLENTSPKTWKAIARNANWHTTRMNINTFARHGVFSDPELVNLLATRLSNRDEVLKAKAFPYQLMVTSLFADGAPPQLTHALRSAMEVAIENIPQVPGGVAVCPDISGSMQSFITGNRGTASTKVTCVMVSALVAAAFLRRNAGNSVLVPFNDKYVPINMDSRRAPVMEIAKAIMQRIGGGTSCESALRQLNATLATQKLVVIVSDNMSWVDIMPKGVGPGRVRNDASPLMHQWTLYKQRVPDAKLVCLDIQPNTTSPAYDRKDILNIGGFSDTVFEVINQFCTVGLEAGNWVKIIEDIDLNDAEARTKQTAESVLE